MLFLFHHGALVWKVGLVVLTLVTMLLIGRRYDWTWATFSMPLIAGAWYVALCWVGNRLLPARGPIDRIPDRLIAASAFPDARDTAIATLEQERTTHDEDGLAVSAAQHVLAGYCPDYVYAKLGRLREARALARLCGRRTYFYDVELGEFDIGEPSVMKSLALGAYAQAAAMLPAESPCMKALFSYWGGDATALATLDAQDSEYCRLLSLVAHDQRVQPDELSISMESFADSLGLGDRFHSAIDTDAPGAWTTSLPTPDTRLVRELVLGTAKGDLRTRRGIDAIVRSGESLSGLRREDDPPRGLLEIARGVAPVELRVLDEDCSIKEPFQKALDGDGAPIADWLRTCSLSYRQYELIAAMLPRVHLHRRELALALRHLEVGELFPDNSPFAMVDRYARRRDLARLAGDTEEAARWQELVDRFVPVLSDRRRAQALAIAIAMD